MNDELAARDITYLAGVGPKRAQLLNKELGIRSYEDLLYNFPYKYIDRSRLFTIAEIDGNMPYIQVKGRICSFETVGSGAARRLVALFSDGTATLELVWFKGIKFVMAKYKLGVEYNCFGKPTLYGQRLNIAHPELDTADDTPENPIPLQAYYSTTEKMKSSFVNSKAVAKMVHNLLATLTSALPETLPASIIQRAHVIYRNEALRAIHLPQSNDLLRQAQFRLKFEELFYLQVNILRYAAQRQQSIKGFVFSHIGVHFHRFYNEVLPFSLTGAQKRVLHEIRADVGSGKQMNRLLQGDVGSGKTLVAFMTLLMAIDNGYQTCLMAPTEILATQHYEGLRVWGDTLGIGVELLTGSTRKKERERIHAGLRAGQVKILIGTHALIEREVEFANLGMAIIDEQHRFGVEQRAKLWQKNNRPPHVLVMTATPIPRTLAMTVYGDLDVSVIDELPPGRKPIETILQYENRRASLYASLGKQLALGRQAYIVFPLIEESERCDMKNLLDGYKHISEVFPTCQVSMVHGRMKPHEKEAAMQEFVSGRSQILVATTVIEVGVNVPNASVMIIENAERFGLSQLHQLRGRVGRGADQSYCILVTKYELSEDTRKRLNILVESNDGFEISEADLQLRGPGDLEGTQQSGIPLDLKIANIARDGQVLQLAREIAREVIDLDPELALPQHRLIQLRLRQLFGRKYNWSLIS